MRATSLEEHQVSQCLSYFIEATHPFLGCARGPDEVHFIDEGRAQARASTGAALAFSMRAVERRPIAADLKLTMIASLVRFAVMFCVMLSAMMLILAGNLSTL